MEIINENYIIIILEYKKKKPNLDSFYLSLMGDKEYHKILKENADLGKKKKFTFFDIPKNINEEFFADMFILIAQRFNRLGRVSIKNV